MIVLNAGSYLFHEGDPPTSAFLIEQGSVEIVLERPEGEVIIAVRPAGEIVGEMAIVDHSPRSASVRACEDSVLLPITDAQIATRMATADPVLRMVLGTILDRFRSTLAEISGIPGKASSSAANGSDPALAAAAFADLKIERELDQAMTEGQIRFHYQPVVSLPSGRLVGFEALARWHHPTRGIVPPSTFVPIAEVSGLSAELARLGMAQIAHDLPEMTKRAEANRAEVELPYVNLNVSGHDLGITGFVQSLARIADDHGIACERVNLELTETAVVRSLSDASSALNTARSKGFGIAIDDFGTGYATLNYVRTMPVDALKIDRSFVESLDDVATNRAIVANMLQLAASLGLSVIAEGVETAREAATLRAMGCSLGQGYLFGRPKAIAETLDLLSNWNAAAVAALAASPAIAVASDA